MSNPLSKVTKYLSYKVPEVEKHFITLALFYFVTLILFILFNGLYLHPFH